MRPLEVEICSDGGVVLSQLAPWTAAVLYELEDLLEPDQPEEVKRRLFPQPSEDAAIREDWERYVHPDLFALIASARAIVREDLAGIVPPTAGVAGWRLDIPARHVRAWISALNAARLTIAELSDVGEEELDATPDELDEEQAVAVAKIRLFGWIQELILEGLYPDAPA